MLDEVVMLFSTGFACGIVVSVLPFVVGSLINFALSIMKKGGN